MENTSLSSYQESIDYLFGLQKYGIKFGLNCTENILTRLGNPHHRLRCIHIAGTNGKGSTAAMLSSMLKQQGLRVGLYTSPHLVRFTERFRINDDEVSPERIIEVFRQVRQVIDNAQPPTFLRWLPPWLFNISPKKRWTGLLLRPGWGDEWMPPMLCGLRSV